MKKLLLSMGIVMLFISPVLAQQVGEFVPARCPVPIPGEAVVDCGYLTVPERHENPDGKTIELAVAILRAENPNPKADAVLYLEGGPGGSALYGLDGWIGVPLVQDRDLILFDQRGTGYSWPTLFCEDYDYDFDPEDEDFIVYEKACAEAMTADDIDLSAYNSKQSAQDAEMLVHALGYEQVNLYGISYGTRLALTILRDSPEIARAVVLDSPYPLHIKGYEMMAINGYNAIDAVLVACANDAACNSAYPDLREDFYAWVESGDSVRGNMGDGVEDIDGYTLVSVLFDVLYDSTAIPLVPKALNEVIKNGDGYLFGDLVSGEYEVDYNEQSNMEAFYELADEEAMRQADIDDYDAFLDLFNSLSDDGRYDLYADALETADEYDYHDIAQLFLGFGTIEETDAYLAAMSDSAYERLFTNIVSSAALGWEDISDSDAVFNSVTCVEEMPFNDMQEAEVLTAHLSETIRESLNKSAYDQVDSCEVWGVTPADALESQMVVSDVPTLVLAGQFDPITPPNFAAATMEGLRNGQLVVITGGGHSIVDAGACPSAIGVAFLDNPTSPVDTTCADALRVNWVTN